MKKHRVIAIGIGIISMGVGLFSYQESFFTSLLQISDIPKTQMILPDAPYRGTFTASYDQLGMVKLRMTNQGRINANTLVFRLREQGSLEWLVENTYVTDRFKDQERYPFGFPIISDAKGKTYEYELTTPDGSEDNTVGVQQGMNAFGAEYRYTTAWIRQDKETMRWFFKEKVWEMAHTMPHIGYWIMVFLPVGIVTQGYAFFTIAMLCLFGLLPIEIHSNSILWIGCVITYASLYHKRYSFPFLLSLLVLFFCIASYGIAWYAVSVRLAMLVPILFIGGCITLYISIKR